MVGQSLLLPKVYEYASLVVVIFRTLGTLRTSTGEEVLLEFLLDIDGSSGELMAQEC